MFIAEVEAMMELDYKLTNDTLFKMLFVKYPELLRRLVAELLAIPFGDIEDFRIVNPEMPPEMMGEKFCRLDINMVVNGQFVDLEIQVNDEGDYPERSLFHWAREYASALPSGEDYINLPRVAVISIAAFKMFPWEKVHSEFAALETTNHEPLTDKMSLHYFELPKLGNAVDGMTGQELWLALFNAKTEEDLDRLKGLGVPEMTQAVEAFRLVKSTNEFKTLARMRQDALSNEAAALRHARNMGAEDERVKWQGVVADQKAALADKDAALADALAELARYRDKFGE